MGIAGHRFWKKDKVRLNFFEWLFLRRCCVAWNFANGAERNITKSEIFNIGL